MDCSADVLEIIDPAAATLNANITVANSVTSGAAQGLSLAQARQDTSGDTLFRNCGQPFLSSSISRIYETVDNIAHIAFITDGSGNAPGFKIDFLASVEGEIYFSLIVVVILSLIEMRKRQFLL